MSHVQNNPKYLSTEECLKDTLKLADELAAKHNKSALDFWVEAEHAGIDTEDYELMRRYYRIISMCHRSLDRGND